MLESRRDRFFGDTSYARSETTEREVPIAPLQLRSLWRHRGLICFMLIAFAVLGTVIALVRPASYTAISRLLIDNRNLQLNYKDAIFAQSAVDLPFVQNQLELLKSEKISLKVITELALTEDREFTKNNGLLAMLKDFGGAPSQKEQSTSDQDQSKRRYALDKLQRNLFIGRAGESYTLEVRFTSNDPEKAAKIANGIVNTYLDEQIAANDVAAQTATAWLRDRLRGLGPNARVITEAAAPIRSDGPWAVSIIVASALVGTLVGSGIAFGKDILDKSIRTPEQAAKLTGVECFGVLPHLPELKRQLRARSKPLGKSAIRPFRFAGASIPPDGDGTSAMFSQTIRRLRSAIMHDHGGLIRSIGVTSTLDGEGKTTIAMNLAHSLSRAGKRVLLVDSVSYNHGLSKHLAPEARIGLFDVLAGKAGFKEAVLSGSDTSVDFLPTGGKPGDRDFDAIWTGEIKKILAQASNEYDYVVFDLPPLAPCPDVRASAHILDALLLIIKWGHTPAPAVEACLSASGSAQSKLLGVLLSDARPKLLKRYDSPLIQLGVGRHSTA